MAAEMRCAQYGTNDEADHDSYPVRSMPRLARLWRSLSAWGAKPEKTLWRRRWTVLCLTFSASLYAPLCAATAPLPVTLSKGVLPARASTP